MSDDGFTPTTNERVPDSPSFDQELIKTGMGEVDSALHGGVPAGSIIAIQYPANSAGDLLGYELATVHDRPTLYLTTARSADSMFQSIERSRTGLDRGLENLAVAALDPTDPLGTSQSQAGSQQSDRGYDPDETLDDALNHISGMDQPRLILDSVSDCLSATDSKEWWSTVRALRDRMTELGGVAFLLFHQDPSAPLADDERRLCHTADGIFQYRRSESGHGGDTLRVSKLRRISEQADDLPIEFELDISRSVTVSREKTF